MSVTQDGLNFVSSLEILLVKLQVQNNKTKNKVISTVWVKNSGKTGILLHPDMQNYSSEFIPLESSAHSTIEKISPFAIEIVDELSLVCLASCLYWV